MLQPKFIGKLSRMKLQARQQKKNKKKYRTSSSMLDPDSEEDVIEEKKPKGFLPKIKQFVDMLKNMGKNKSRVKPEEQEGINEEIMQPGEERKQKKPGLLNKIFGTKKKGEEKEAAESFDEPPPKKTWWQMFKEMFFKPVKVEPEVEASPRSRRNMRRPAMTIWDSPSEEDEEDMLLFVRQQFDPETDRRFVEGCNFGKLRKPSTGEKTNTGPVRMDYRKRKDPTIGNPMDFTKENFKNEIHPSKNPNWVYQLSRPEKTNYYKHWFYNISFLGTIHNYLMTVLHLVLYLAVLYFLYEYSVGGSASFTVTNELVKTNPSFEWYLAETEGATKTKTSLPVCKSTKAGPQSNYLAFGVEKDEFCDFADGLQSKCRQLGALCDTRVKLLSQGFVSLCTFAGELQAQLSASINSTVAVHRDLLGKAELDRRVKDIAWNQASAMKALFQAQLDIREARYLIDRPVNLRVDEVSTDLLGLKAVTKAEGIMATNEISTFNDCGVAADWALVREELSVGGHTLKWYCSLQKTIAQLELAALKDPLFWAGLNGDTAFDSFELKTTSFASMEEAIEGAFIKSSSVPEPDHEQFFLDCAPRICNTIDTDQDQFATLTKIVAVIGSWWSFTMVLVTTFYPTACAPFLLPHLMTEKSLKITVAEQNVYSIDTKVRKARSRLFRKYKRGEISEERFLKINKQLDTEKARAH